MGLSLKALWSGLCMLCVLFTHAQVDESQRLKDSIRIANYERKLAGDSTVVIEKPSFQSDLNFTAESIDTTPPKNIFQKKHKPATAVWMSAALPGLGQAYNKKYWKIPIVYAGFAGLGYAVYYTATNYTLARNAYRLQVDEDPTTIGQYQGYSDPATLKAQRDFHKRNLTIAGACTGVWYFLNLIDAAVDAHLFYFEVSDKLSMDWGPKLAEPSYSPTVASQYGLSLRFHLR